MTDEFKTLKGEVHAETKVQGSRFIATAAPFTTRAEAEEFIARLRKAHFDATHNCYAYRLGHVGDVFRFNDDGEPSGTAGKPILAAIDKFGLTDIAVVVTRYYGGTKLGVGGLIRAYSGTAEKALASAEHLTKYILETFDATFPHSHISSVMHVVSKLDARILETTYDEDVHLKIAIRQSKAEALKSALIDQTGGNIEIRLGC